MGIVGPRPETGLRIDLERPVAGGPPWRYEGRIATAEAQFRLTAHISETGAVTVEAPDPLPEGVAQKAKLLLRAAWKHASGDEAPPPRRIVRWRA
jgi:hypothetical protein